MKWEIVVIGKPALAYAKSGMETYLTRLRRHVSAEVIVLRDSAALWRGGRLDKLREGAFLVALDERGLRWTTGEFRAAIDRWEGNGSIKRIVLFIGGADGHDNAVRSSADLVLSLSSFTLQHELALVVFLEQLYRVYSLKNGEPYHR